LALPGYAGNLAVTIKDQTGALRSGINVWRYTSSWAYLDQKTTDANGLASWTGISAGTYQLQVYHHNSTQGVDEFWGGATPTVPASATTNVTIQRYMPYATAVHVFNGSTEVTGGSVPVGTTVRVEVAIRNAGVVSYNARAVFWLDRDAATPYDFLRTNATQLIGAGLSVTSVFNCTLSSAGAYQRTVQIQTDVNSGSYAPTDAWDWSTLVTATRITGDLNATVKDQTGALRSGIKVQRYTSAWAYLDQKTTDANGLASWTGISPGTYQLQVYHHNSTQGVDEFWGGATPTVPTNGAANVPIQRYMPYASSCRVFNGATEVTGGSVPVGTPVRVEVVVTNAGSVSYNARVALWLDQSGGAPYDFVQTNSSQTIAAHGSVTSVFYYTLSTVGSYQRVLQIQTDVNSGSYAPTDAWDWGTVVTATRITGDLNVTVKDQNGALASGIKVWRYTSIWTYLDQKTTDANGLASWTGISAGTYQLQAYHHNSTQGVDEFWGGATPTVLVGSTTNVTIQRYMPYATAMRIFNGSTEVTGGSVPVGTAVRVEVPMRNDGSVGYNARAALWLDRDAGSPYDFAVTNASQLIGAGLTVTSVFNCTLSSTGAYQRTLQVQTDVNSGSYTPTDAWDWGSVLTVIPATGNLVVTVRNPVGNTQSNVNVQRFTTGWGYLDQKTTDANGLASWSGITAGTYQLQAYHHNSTQAVDEFWGGATPTVVVGGTTNVTIQRYMPYATAIRIFNGSTEVTGGSVPVGTTVRVEIPMRNDGSVGYNARAALWLDRDAGSPYDFLLTNASQLIGAGLTVTSIFNCTLPSTGAYQRTLQVQTDVNSGSYAPTDAWDWGSALTVIPAMGNLAVTVENQVGNTQSNVNVQRYTTGWSYLDQKATDANGLVSWNGIAAGAYQLQVSRSNVTHRVDEFWGGATPTVPVGGTTNVTIQRYMPYAIAMRLFNGSTEVTGGSVPVGTTLRAEVAIRNGGTVGYNARAVLWLDRDATTPYDFLATNATQLVGPGLSVTSVFNCTLSSTGAYQRTLQVQTDVNSGNYTPTDAWDWSPVASAVPNSYPGTFALVSPTNGSVNTGTRPAFTWTPSTNATGYQICVVDWLGFAKISQSVTNTFYVPTGTEMTYGADYAWHVIAIHSIGQQLSQTNAFNTGSRNVGARLIGLQQTSSNTLLMEIAAEYDVLWLTPRAVWVEYTVGDSIFPTRVPAQKQSTALGQLYYVVLDNGGSGFQVHDTIHFTLAVNPISDTFPPWPLPPPLGTVYSQSLSHQMYEQGLGLEVVQTEHGYVLPDELEPYTVTNCGDHVVIKDLKLQNHLACWLRLYATNLETGAALRTGAGEFEDPVGALMANKSWLQLAANLVLGHQYGPAYLRATKIDLFNLISVDTLLGHPSVVKYGELTYLSEEALHEGGRLQITAFKGGIGQDTELLALNIVDTIVDLIPVLEAGEDDDTKKTILTHLAKIAVRIATDNDVQMNLANGLANNDPDALFELFTSVLDDTIEEFLKEEDILKLALQAVGKPEAWAQGVAKEAVGAVTAGQAIGNMAVRCWQFKTLPPDDTLTLEARIQGVNFNSRDLLMPQAGNSVVAVGSASLTNAERALVLRVGSTTNFEFAVCNSSDGEILFDVWMAMDLYAPSDVPNSMGLLYAYTNKVENTLTPIPDPDTGRRGRIKFRVAAIDGVSTNIDYTDNADHQSLHFLDIPPGHCVTFRSDPYTFDRTTNSVGQIHTYAQGRYMARLAVWRNGFPGDLGGIPATTIYDSMAMPLYLLASTSPPAPTGLFVTNGFRSLFVGWQPLARLGAAGETINRDVLAVAVYRATNAASVFSSDSNVVAIQSANNSLQGVVDTNVLSGVTYYYGVKSAKLDGAKSTSSQIVSGRVPAGLLVATPSAFELTGSGSQTQYIGSLTVANQGVGAMNLSVAASPPWLSTDLTNASLSRGAMTNINVYVSLGTMAFGTNLGSLTINAPGADGSPAQVSITVSKMIGGLAAVTPSTAMHQVEGGSGVQTVTGVFTLRNQGDNSMTWTVSGSVDGIGAAIYSPSQGTLVPNSSTQIVYSVDVPRAPYPHTYYLVSMVGGTFVNPAPQHSAAISVGLPSVSLDVQSAHGNPSPAVGRSQLASGSPVNATVGSPSDDNGAGTRYRCTGWTGTGSVPATGHLNSVSFTINQNSSLTWNWWPQYLLTPLPTTNGSIWPDSPQWVDQGGTVIFTATSLPGYSVEQWLANGTVVQSGGTSYTHSVLAPVSIAVTFSTNSAPAGLIAYYRFDGSAEDASGKGNDGTLFDCVPVVDRDGVASGALRFNGVDSRVDILSLNTNPIITLCAWVRPEAGSSEDFMVVVAGDNGGWDRGFDLGRDGSTQVHEGNRATNISTAIPFDTWSHVALVYSATDILLYVNGELIWQKGGPAVGWDEGNWCIGRNNASGGHWPFKGAIDDVRIYGRALSASEVVRLCNPPEEALIAYYPFNGDASDLSGSGNDGTVVGCVPAVDRHSVPAGALSFNGLDTHVHILSLNTNPIITLCAWVRPEAGSSEDFMAVVTGDNGGWDRGFDLGRDGSTQVHEGNQSTNIGTAIPFGTWSQIALVYSSTDILLYVNGALVWQKGGPAVGWDEGNWCIGRNNASGGHWPFKGAIDEVRIYGRALSASEVVQLCNPLEGGLIAYYPFNGDASDHSGNGNGGTVVSCIPAVDRYSVPSGALGFSGIDSRVDILSLNTNPIITLCAWIRPEAGSSEDFMAVVTGDNGGWDRGFDLGTNGSTQVHEGNRATDISTAIPFGNWSHVAVVYSSTDILLYVNGALIWQRGGPAVGWDEGNWCIGRNNASGGHWPFKGAIDDVRIYGRPLSAAEVAALIVTPLARPGLSMALLNDSMQVSFETELGRVYWLQASTNLSNWTTIYGNTGTGALVQFTDTGFASSDARFYRVLVFPSPNTAPHPADLNADFAITTHEIGAYTYAWKSGTPWPIPPSPVPDNYFSKAQQIWKGNGGPTTFRYHCDPSLPPPDCWVPEP
jgi:hypothetical protein